MLAFLTAMHGLRLCIDLAIYACYFCEQSTYVRAVFPMHVASIYALLHRAFAFVILMSKAQQGSAKGFRL